MLFLFLFYALIGPLIWGKGTRASWSLVTNKKKEVVKTKELKNHITTEGHHPVPSKFQAGSATDLSKSTTGNSTSKIVQFKFPSRSTKHTTALGTGLTPVSKPNLHLVPFFTSSSWPKQHYSDTGVPRRLIPSNHQHEPPLSSTYCKSRLERPNPAGTFPTKNNRVAPAHPSHLGSHVNLRVWALEIHHGGCRHVDSRLDCSHSPEQFTWHYQRQQQVEQRISRYLGRFLWRR